MGIGVLKMSGVQMYARLKIYGLIFCRLNVNQGPGVQSMHCLNDGLWRNPILS